MVVGRSPGLEELFTPQSIAVIGASNKVGTVGASLFRNLLTAGFQGVVYPVNPSWKSVSGVRCYPSVRELPEVPDLAVIIVPAAKVNPVVRDLGQRGTKGIVVVSAGFREVGGHGLVLENKLSAIAAAHRMSLVGPNCFGVINTDPTRSLNATFSEELPPRGNIAFVSQSGALCAGILQYGIAERIGFSRFVSVGNRAGVDENDLLYSLGRDRATKVILLYVESLSNGRKFLEAARKVTERKPILVIKSGRTPAGERAALSHTGSLARSGQDQLYDALFEQSGVLRAESIGDLFRMAKIFSSGLHLTGPRLAILTNSGGPGILAADAAQRHGLELPLPPTEVRTELRTFLSPSASIGNPVDMTADSGAVQYRRALRRLLRVPEIDSALVIATPTGTLTGSSVAEAILEGSRQSAKPVIACLFGLTDLSREVKFLETKGVPTFTFPEEAISGLASLARYRAWETRPRTELRSFAVDRAAIRTIFASARPNETTVLPEFLARSLLAAYGIPTPRAMIVHDLGEATEAAQRIGFPVALKVASRDISHKTDVGGVALGLQDPGQLNAAWTAMQQKLARHAPKARIDGFEVEQMIAGGKEVLVGLQRDANFGPIVVFGLGGIYVEVLRDVTFRLAPIRPLSAERMVASVKAFPLLQGVRGDASGDLAALYGVIERVSQLAVQIPRVLELDINPLLVLPEGRGVCAVDARVVLGPSSKSASRSSRGRSGNARRQTRPRGAGPRRPR
ncbi:MAG: acetate--CoA ligase family protein [Thermoplasmata archaeon]